MTTPVLELDEVLQRYAWNIVKKRSNFVRRLFLDEDDYIFTIDWSSLTLEHKIHKFNSKHEDGTLVETNWGKVLTGSKWVSLWSCDFDNKTDSKQTHSFRGSRDTTTWVDVDLHQYYTIGKEVCVQVNIPLNFSKYRAGRDNSLNLNKVKGQVFKERLTWEVNSEVEVQPSWRANAQLLAKGECSVMEFEIRTTLHIPKGAVNVLFLRKFVKKSQKLVAHVVNIDNLEEVFKLEEEGGVLKPGEKLCIQVMTEKTVDQQGLEKSSSYIQLITRGSFICLSWSDQKVDITTSPLDGAVDDGDRDTNLTMKNLSEKQIDVKSY